MVTDQGTLLSRYRTSKLMKSLKLVSCQQPKHKYRKSGSEHIAIPNYLDRQFAVTAPNKVWVGDVTFVWTGNRWAYLAVVIDLFSRKPIGWAMSLSPDSKLTGKALSMAFESRGQPEGILFHSDREAIIQVGNIVNYFGVIESSRAYHAEEIVGITVRWNVSSEV